MSGTVDDDLLGDEDGDDVYDISNEREEALLQEDEDFSKGRDSYDSKKESASDSDEPEDVLNLDIEEDFQDEDELYKDEPPHERKEGKFLVERQTEKSQLSANTGSILNGPLKTTQGINRAEPTAKKSNVAQKVNNSKKVVPKNDKWKRGTGRGNFQTRPNFVKNSAQRRRNGTVLINPRYEGTVHINENNARLAWDSPQYPPNQTNFIKPWVSGNSYDVNPQDQLLIKNLVSEITNFGQSSTNMLIPQTQTSQNYYQEPRINYEPPLMFEPPPNIVNPPPLKPSYNNQNQVTNHQMFPSSPQPYSRGGSQQMNSSLSTTNRMQGDFKTFGSYPSYGQYDRTNAQQDYTLGPSKSLNPSSSYENKTLNYNRYSPRLPTSTSNYSSQNYFENKSSGYANGNYPNKSSNYASDSYQIKNSNYSNNYGPVNYEEKSFSDRYSIKQGLENVNYRGNLNQNQNSSTYVSKFQPKPLQGQFRNDVPRSNTFATRMDNQYVPNRNFNKQGNRRPAINEYSDMKIELPEKKVKTNESSKAASVKSSGEEPERANSVPNTQQRNTTPHDNITTEEWKEEDEDEDEETRLYRLKIEEQKRERERVLRIKEERRKQMLLQRQKQAEAKPAAVESVEQKHLPIKNYQQPNQKSAQVPKQNHFEQSAGTVTVQKANEYYVAQRVNQFAAGPSHRQTTLSGPSQRTNQYPTASQSSQAQTSAQYSSNSNSNVPVELSNLTFKVSNNLQENVPIAKDVPKTEASSSSFMSNRVVVVKSKNYKSGILPNSNVGKTVEASNESSDVGQGLSSFLNNRKVLKKDNNLLNTRLVVVNNLSATINQNKLMALTRGIGEIQKLRVDTQERQATILFKSVASAHAFFKKYQRRILDDLSVIEVKLEPMM